MRRSDSRLGIWIDIVSGIIDEIGRMVGTGVSSVIRRYSLRLPSFLEAEPDEHTDKSYEDCSSNLISIPSGDPDQRRTHRSTNNDTDRCPTPACRVSVDQCQRDGQLAYFQRSRRMYRLNQDLVSP